MGEMVSYLPIDGSYVEFASRFVDDSFGFALGWLVFYNYAVTVAAEATAVAGMINYWNSDINNAVWCTLFLVSIVLFVRLAGGCTSYADRCRTSLASDGSVRGNFTSACSRFFS